MAWSRVAFTVPLLYQQLFYVPPPPPAVAAPPAFTFVSITTAAPFNRTLFYQAEVNPPPPPPPPPLAGQTFSAVTGAATRKTLFYQAKIEPVPLPVVAAVAAPTIDWQQPFSRPAPGPAPTTRYAPFVPAPPAAPPAGWDYTTDGKQGVSRALLALPGGQPFVPKEAVLDNTVPLNSWFQPLSRTVDPLPRAVSDVTYAEVPSNLTTTLEWMVAWQSPPRYLQQLASGVVSSYQPPTAVSNLTTTLEWQIAWTGPPRVLQPLAGGPTYVQQASNLTTTLEWLQAWKGPPRTLLGLPGGQPFVPRAAVLDNTSTPDNWLQRWQGPPKYSPAQAGGQPFVPKEAVLENTIPLSGWLQPLGKAVEPLPRTVSDVTYAQPPVAAVSNLTTTLEWMVAWQGPPRVLQPLAGGVTYVQQASNLTTTLEWLQAWKGPPTYQPIKVQTPPFVPREAVLDNSQTPDKWLLAWQGPPRYWPIKVQTPPFIPREAVLDNSVPFGWQISWQGPPRVLQPLASGSPFVPKAAVLDNTVTPDAFLYRFEKAVPAPKPVVTQPVFGYPYVSASNLTTTLEWMQAWQGPPRFWPLGKPYQPFVPKQATIDNTITGIAWLQNWQGPPRYWPLKVQTPPFVPKEVVQDRITPDKWLVRFQAAVPATKPIHTQPSFVYSPAAPSNLTTTLEWMQAWQGPPRYTPAKILAQPFVPKEAVRENTVALTGWLRDLSRPVAARPVAYPQIAWNLAPVVAPTPPAFAGFTVTANFPVSRSLFYQSWAFGTEPPPAPPPPPPGPPPKHSHAQIRSATGQTGIVAGGVVCVTTFQPGAFQDGAFEDDAFETNIEIRVCQADDEGGPSTSQVRVRSARSRTSSRWRKGRVNIRSGRARTKPRDDP